MTDTIPPFTLSRAQITVHTEGKRPQRLGRLAFAYDGTRAELRGRRGQLVLEAEVASLVLDGNGRWTVTLTSGDSWTIRRGCGCGG